MAPVTCKRLKLPVPTSLFSACPPASWSWVWLWWIRLFIWAFERERERHTHTDINQLHPLGTLTHNLRHLDPQARYVLWAGIEPATFWCMEWCFIQLSQHPARAGPGNFSKNNYICPFNYCFQPNQWVQFCCHSITPEVQPTQLWCPLMTPLLPSTQSLQFPTLSHLLHS